MLAESDRAPPPPPPLPPPPPRHTYTAAARGTAPAWPSRSCYSSPSLLFDTLCPGIKRRINREVEKQDFSLIKQNPLMFNPTTHTHTHTHARMHTCRQHTPQHAQMHAHLLQAIDSDTHTIRRTNKNTQTHAQFIVHYDFLHIFEYNCSEGLYPYNHKHQIRCLVCLITVLLCAQAVSNREVKVLIKVTIMLLLQAIP